MTDDEIAVDGGVFECTNCGRGFPVAAGETHQGLCEDCEE